MGTANHTEGVTTCLYHLRASDKSSGLCTKAPHIRLSGEQATRVLAHFLLCSELTFPLNTKQMSCKPWMQFGHEGTRTKASN